MSLSNASFFVDIAPLEFDSTTGAILRMAFVDSYNITL